MDIERRKHPRSDAFRTGTLFFAEGRQCLDCLLWNVGPGGALLEVEDSGEVASEGRLISEAMYLDREYRVIWRNGRKIGVDFKA
jgi:hypothetical protein